ncbi:down syndrome cell adhesion molecule homolog [Trichonephila clavipes]|nr:down syndrome cell adhesion molecule homolog [Trichonephila clavipes]
MENANVNAPPVNKNDEITLYQIGRYISSNEAAWRIFGFPIHERIQQLFTRAQILWEIHKDSMTDDILHQHRMRCHDPTITFSDEMYNEALIAIEDLCIVIANLP